MSLRNHFATTNGYVKVKWLEPLIRLR